VNRPNHPFETAEIATAGIYVFSSQGSLIDLMPIPRDETTNCGFGGADMKTLFVTAGGTLWGIRTKVPGLPFDRSKQ
jgi:gluconolactonase